MDMDIWHDSVSNSKLNHDIYLLVNLSSLADLSYNLISSIWVGFWLGAGRPTADNKYIFSSKGNGFLTTLIITSIWSVRTLLPKSLTT